MKKIYGGIEAGGTKFVCLAVTETQEIVGELKFPTTTPEDAIGQLEHFFKPYHRQLTTVGIASFGPLDLDPSSPHYGYITTTPKPGWGYTDLLGSVQRILQVPVAIETDVNAAAFGEHFLMPENQNLDPFIYITVGTGIGVGVLVNGKPLHGLVHPEAGHMVLPHDFVEDPFEGCCPYHKDCWEGLASGTAMAQRWGQPAETLPDDHLAWQLEAKYISHAIANLIYTCSPKRVVLGGGVSQRKGLLHLVQQNTLQVLSNYVQSESILKHVDSFIVSPGLGSRSGSLGAVALAINLVHAGSD